MKELCPDGWMWNYPRDRKGGGRIVIILDLSRETLCVAELSTCRCSAAWGMLVSEATPDHALSRTCEMIMGTGNRFITLEPLHMLCLHRHRIAKFKHSLRTFYI